MPRSNTYSKNLSAFLDTITWSEIGQDLIKETDDGYNVLVGSTRQHPLLFADYSDHPRVLNVPLNSTAAGGYQIIVHEFDIYKIQLKLPDFGPESQDKIAVQMIKECHAISLIEAGEIEAALVACASRWASFPGNHYGQHIQKITDLVAVYKKAGGISA